MARRAFDYQQLPLAERVQLVEDIWDSIAQEANVHPEALPISEAQRAELRYRALEADADPGGGIPGEEVRDQLFRRGG